MSNNSRQIKYADHPCVSPLPTAATHAEPGIHRGLLSLRKAVTPPVTSLTIGLESRSEEVTTRQQTRRFPPPAPAFVLYFAFSSINANYFQN